MENWIQKVISKWKSEGVKLNPPTSISDINKAEVLLKFKFPTDFKEFYLNANGFAELAWQEHMFTLWPLELIIKEFEESKDDKFIGFCDFLLASHFIGFVNNKEGVFKAYNRYENFDFIAPSFKNTIGLINSSASSVY
jgi:hypothetical protein